MSEANSHYESVKELFRRAPQTWLVTGAGGFIGSHLVDSLLRLGQHVIGLDNLSSGKRENLDEVSASLKPLVWSRFRFLKGDIRDRALCREACQGVNIILHQAAACSVPASIQDPAGTHDVNVTGFLNILEAARQSAVKRVVYASSCAVYGDSVAAPNLEDVVGMALSPYALSKYMDELYAGIFARAYDCSSIGLRYFNVFGPRQDPSGAYAAVIPRWITALLLAKIPTIYGDGETTRDFCFVENIVQANILAAETQSPNAMNQVYNVGVGQSTSLNTLYRAIRDQLGQRHKNLTSVEAQHEPFRPGDIRHSSGDISKAARLLQYRPIASLEEGLGQTVAWHERRIAA